MDPKETSRDVDGWSRRRRGSVFGGLALVLAGSCGQVDEERPPAPRPVVAAPGPVEQALPAFLAARGKTWPASSPRVAQAKQAISAGDLRRALALLRREHASDATNTEALFLASAVYYQQARFGVALTGFEEVLRRGPSFAENEQAFYLYGACQMRLGNARQARAAFLAVLQLAPGSAQAFQALGELDLQEGDVAQALLRFEQALASLQAAQAQGLPVQGELARAHARMGDAFLQAGQLEQARQHLEQALSTNPDDAPAHYALSRVLFRLGDKEGAARELEQYQRRRVEDDHNRPSRGTEQ